MTLINPAYASLADLQRRFSAAAVTSFADNDDDGSADSGVVDDSINWATEEINLYCQGFYTPARLATSTLVNRWATILGAYQLSLNRGNPPPESWTVQVQQVYEQLSQIQQGLLRIPGLPLRADMSPSASNITIDRRYPYRKQRVTPNSTQQSSMLPQDKVPFPPVVQ